MTDKDANAPGQPGCHQVESLEKRVDDLRAMAGRLDIDTPAGGNRNAPDGNAGTGLLRGRLQTGGRAPAKEQLRALADGLDDLKAELAALQSGGAPLVDGLRVWDGKAGAADVWDPQNMRLPLAGEAAADAPAGSGPVLLWPKTGDENPMEAELRAAGLRWVNVLPSGQQADANSLTAGKALRLYRGQAVGIICTDAACAPFIDAFPNKTLLLCGVGEGESTQALRRLADVQCAAGDAAARQQAARRFASLCRARAASVADVVVLAATQYDDVPQRPQQLARVAAESGRRVLFVNAAAGSKTRLLAKEGNLYSFELAAWPGSSRRDITQTPGAEGQAHYQAEVEYLLAALGVDRALFKVDHPFWGGTAFALRRRLRFPVLYDCYEDFAAWPGAPADAIQKAERSLLGGADFVVTASSALAKHTGLKGPRSQTIRNGGDAAHFSKAYTPGKAAGSPAVLGYYGPLGWLNIEVLRALDASNLDVEIRLLGDAEPGVKSALAACRKVKLLPAVPYAERPAALEKFDIALLPLDTARPAVEASSPPVFYEYLAAGKPVVSTAIPELMVFRGRFACLENDPGWFVRRVRECLDGISSLAGAEERVAFAAQNSWASRGESFEEIYRKLELARGRAIRGDIWAEQAAKDAENEPEAPMLAMPAPEKKNAADGILKMQLAGALASNREMRTTLHTKDENTKKALEATRRIMTAKSHRFAGFTGRLRGQLLHGSAAERKAFVNWMLGDTKENDAVTRRYQPLYTVHQLLEENLRLSEARAEHAFETPPGGNVPELAPVYTQCDVLVFPPLGFETRRQRPQQLALQAAAAGHRVFYFEPRFASAPAVHKKTDNLYVVELPGNPGASIFEQEPDAARLEGAMDALLWHFGIRDAISVVAHPNWVDDAARLRDSFGFKLVADCPGDFTGFLTPGSERSEKNGMQLLETADVVIPASEALATIAKQVRGGDFPLVRSGSDHAHFHTAFAPDAAQPAAPSPAAAGKEGSPAPAKRPVVGYVGVVSHWFDADAVCHLARSMPEADIVLVGQVVEWEELLRGHSNIKLLGERPYAQLPAIIKGFDVAVLPYDTQSDTTRAADPAEFWELLSAGKKIVSSHIPALVHHKGDYLLVAKDKDDFVKKIRRCMEGKDGLKPAEERAAFAAKNSWQARWQDFYALAREAFPLISVVVATQNNLAHCKACIESVLSQTACPRYELLVVDRASTDGTRECLEALEKAEVPNLRVLCKAEDPGYAAACNEGIRAAAGKYVVLLQDNTLVTRGWLSAMACHMEQDDKLALCGPATNLGGGEAKVPVYYRALDEMNQFAYLAGWHRHGQLRTRGKSLSFFCAMLRKSATDTCGMLDEKYTGEVLPGYDWAMAVTKQGLQLAVAEDAFVHCDTDEPLRETLDEAAQERFAADRARYEEKWDTRWKPRGYRPGVNREMNRDTAGLVRPEEAQAE